MLLVLGLLALGVMADLAPGLSPGAYAQTNEDSEVAQPVNEPAWDTTLLENEELSGWLSVELAVLIDTRPEILASEYWPPRPNVTYPARHRSLIIANELAQLSERFPFSVSRQDPNGSIEIAIPEPEVFIERDKQQQLERAQQRIALDETLALAQTEQAQANREVQANTSSGLAVPLESLASQESIPRPTIDSLSVYQSPQAAINELSLQAPTQSPEAIELGSTTDVGERGQQPLVIVSQAEPPPLPTAFTQQAPDVLAPGLRQLLRETNDKLAFGVAWLQPPEAPNLPIVLDASGDSSDWPEVQGFVQIRRGENLRLGVNIWLNTQGAYLPDSFQIPAPPRGPTRIRYVDLQSGQPLLASTVTERQARLAQYELERPIMQRALLDFLRGSSTNQHTETAAKAETSIGTQQGWAQMQKARQDAESSVDTGEPEFHTEHTSIASVLAAFPSSPPAEPLSSDNEVYREPMAEAPNQNTDAASIWPYRHLIHVADTRIIPDGKIRYIDHPAIKILAVYRELSWAEVYHRGIAEYDKRRVTPKADLEDILSPPPSMVIPPSIDEVY